MNIDQIIEDPGAALDEIEGLRASCAAYQARIDELMFEYCPDEMTQQQIEEYEQHQVSERID